MKILAQAGCEINEPPHTNRGVGVSHIQDVVFSFDWVRLTVWADLGGVLPLLEVMGLDVGLEEAGHGGLGFRRVLVGLNGFQLYAEPSNPGAVYVSLNLPSKCLQFIGVEKLLAGVSWLSEMGLAGGLRWQCTRLDLAFDLQSFTVEQFAAAYHSGAVETKTRSWNEIRGSGDGHTFYVGSRESTALLRVYNKMDGSSFGDEAFTRVELELKADRAALALSEIFAAPMENWADMASAWIVGFCTVKAEWWAAWLGGVRRSWLRLRQNIPTVERVRVWLEKQVLPSLACYVGAVSGGDIEDMKRLLMGMVADGRGRLSKRQEAMMENYQADVSPHFAVFAL